MGNAIRISKLERQEKRKKQDEFEITIGGELETWYMFFVDFNRSPDGNYLTDSKDVSPTYPLPIGEDYEIGVKIEGAGRSTPLINIIQEPTEDVQLTKEEKQFLTQEARLEKKLIQYLNMEEDEAEKRSGQSRIIINVPGHGEKEFRVPAKSILKNKLFGGTEFIYDPLPGEKYVVTKYTVVPTFLRVLKQGIRRSQEAFQSNFVECQIVSPPIFPNLYKTYFDIKQNLLVFNVLGGNLPNILSVEDFNQMPFVPQITFGINVYRLVDFMQILDKTVSEIYLEAEDVISRYGQTVPDKEEDRDGFQKFILDDDNMKKIIDFIFLCLYSFYDSDKATKDECDFKFRFLLRDVFRYFFKHYRSEIVDKIRANIIGGKDGPKGEFIIKVLSTSQEQSKQTQKLQRVNLFGIRDGNVLVEWRDFTRYPRTYLRNKIQPEQFLQFNPNHWKPPIITGAMCELFPF
uniref:Uncharacterized protein n=1 Tax=viral metagenome TaxID=1070528 RepID=A0A6C0D069_9ZZZZ